MTSLFGKTVNAKWASTATQKQKKLITEMTTKYLQKECQNWPSTSKNFFWSGDVNEKCSFHGTIHV